MNKKLKESQLRTIVRGIIKEMVNEGGMVSNPAKSMAARAAEEEAEKSGGQPGAIYKGSLEEAGPKGGFEAMMGGLESEESKPRPEAQPPVSRTSKIKGGKKSFVSKTQKGQVPAKVMAKWKASKAYAVALAKVKKTTSSIRNSSLRKNTFNNRMRVAMHRWLAAPNKAAPKKSVKKEGTAKDEFDVTNPTKADHEPPDKSLFEDSEAKETYDYAEDEGADKKRLSDLSPEHAAALKKDMAYDEEHEDRHEAGTHFAESFFPKGRDIRSKARAELNETLMKRWSKIIK